MRQSRTCGAKLLSGWLKAQGQLLGGSPADRRDDRTCSAATRRTERRDRPRPTRSRAATLSSGVVSVFRLSVVILPSVALRGVHLFVPATVAPCAADDA